MGEEGLKERGGGEGRRAVEGRAGLEKDERGRRKMGGAGERYKGGGKDTVVRKGEEGGGGDGKRAREGSQGPERKQLPNKH